MEALQTVAYLLVPLHLLQLALNLLDHEFFDLQGGWLRCQLMAQDYAN